eukprot:5685195-Pyramimonas_sp.AAC.1
MAPSYRSGVIPYDVKGCTSVNIVAVTPRNTPKGCQWSNGRATHVVNDAQKRPMYCSVTNIFTIQYSLSPHATGPPCT